MLIPIDDDAVPDGYEPVRFGSPNIGEQYFANGDIAVATVSLSPRLIVRKTWQPPAWLKPGWIATNGGLVGGFAEQSVRIGGSLVHYMELYEHYEYHTDRRAKDGWQPCGKVVK